MESLNVDADSINIDLLDVQAFDTCFRRFDVFNSKYNPMGEPQLRTIFLKSSNFIKGRYLAELTQKMFQKLEEDPYSYSEYRISIYGRSMSEWNELAEWILSNRLQSSQNRWMIQIPRLYKLYRKMGMPNFMVMIHNFFYPLF